MTFEKALRAWIVCGATFAGTPGASSLAAAAEACKEPEAGTQQVPMLSPPMAGVVTGTGRLQFYSAPHVRCPMDGVFVIPNDRLIAYAETRDGWSSVMYVNPRTGADVSGWVKSARLRRTGTVGPKQ
jgi:hypothetical protein